MNNTLTTTLFVGIDVSSKTNYAFAMDFFGNKLLSIEVQNNLPGAEILLHQILEEQQPFHYIILLDKLLNQVFFLVPHIVAIQIHHQ